MILSFLAGGDTYDRDGVADHAGGRFSTSGPVGIGRNLHQGSDQAKQCLMFRPIRLVAEKCRQFDMRQPTARGSIRLVNDESASIGWLARQEPCVAVRTPV